MNAERLSLENGKEHREMQFRAYGNRILVEADPPESRRRIALPDGTTLDPVRTGTVVSVGAGVMTAHGWDYPQVKVGDRIAWMKGQGIPFPSWGANYFCLWLAEVMAVEKESDMKPLAHLVE